MTQQSMALLPTISTAVQAYYWHDLSSAEGFKRMKKMLTILLWRLFSLTEPGVGLDEDHDARGLPHIFESNSFYVLVHLCYSLRMFKEFSHQDFFACVKLCWLLDVFSTLAHLLMKAFRLANGEGLEEQIKKLRDEPVKRNLGLARLLNELCSVLHLESTTGALLDRWLSDEEIYKACEASGLIFARRAVLFGYAFLGIVPPTGKYGFGFEGELQDISSESDTRGVSELERLAKYLELPSLTEVLSVETLQVEQSGSLNFTSTLVKCWFEGFRKVYGLPKSLVPYTTEFKQWNYPLGFEFFSLPQRLDQLFEQSRSFICANCSTCPSNPALCLVCGTIVCGQSYCCLDPVDGSGECNTHSLQ
jgi:E3 ubiquitin-protein ligase UBR1